MPSHLVRPEFGEINVRSQPDGVVVSLTMTPTMEGAKAEGWQTGVALDASYSMRQVYGRGTTGSVPPDIMASYEGLGWVKEQMIDGRRTKRLSQEAQAD